MPLPDAETLRRYYEQDGMTLREIAALAHCRMATVIERMRGAGIARRRSGRKRLPLPDIPPQLLHEMTKLSGRKRARQVAKHAGINREKFDRLLGHRLMDRGSIEHHHVYPHDAAIRAGYDAGTPIQALARHYHCSRRVISRSLDRTTPLPQSYVPHPVGKQ